MRVDCDVQNRLIDWKEIFTFKLWLPNVVSLGPATRFQGFVWGFLRQ